MTKRHMLLRLAFWAALIALLYLAVGRPMPGGPTGVMSVNDKLVHGAVYGCLALLGLMGRFKPIHVLSILLAHGALVEVLQSLVPDRNADWHDFLADSIGVVTSLVAACLVKRHSYYS